MKKFLFRLETLLQHRRNIEERERTKFSDIRARLAAELCFRESLEAKQAEAWSELAGKKKGNCDTAEIGWYEHYLMRLSQEILKSAERAAQLEKLAEEQKQVMIGASRDKKMIENLRGKKEKEFFVTLERNDRKAVDELVVSRFGLKP